MSYDVYRGKEDLALRSAVMTSGARLPWQVDPNNWEPLLRGITDVPLDDEAQQYVLETGFCFYRLA